MKLLTKAILKSLPLIGTTEGQGGEAIIRVKFFDPWSNWKWYAVEYDPIEELFYGLVVGFEKELGYFSLAQLLTIKGLGRVGIERDLYFDPQPVKNFCDLWKE